MTPDATVQRLTARHAQLRDELDAAFGQQVPLETLRVAIERHRVAIQLSAFWLLTETGARTRLRERFRRRSKQLQERVRTLRALTLRGAPIRAETRRILEVWFDAVRELVDAAARETTSAGRELLVRAYQRAHQLKPLNEHENAL